MTFWKYLFPAILWMVFIAILLSISISPSKDPIFTIPHLDKIVHFFLFSVLTILYAWGFKKQSKYTKIHSLALILTAFIGITYGICTELFQHFLIEDRAGDFFDVIADTTGVVFGLIGYIILPSQIK